MDGTAGWRCTHTHTHVHTRTHVTSTRIPIRPQTRSSFGLYLSPEVQESAVYIRVHTYINVYTRICTCMYAGTYIKRSTLTISRVSSLSLSFSRSLPLLLSLLRATLSASRFQGLAFMASIHSSGEIRVPSSLKLVIETYARAYNQRDLSPLARPRENPRLIAISPLCELPRSIPHRLRRVIDSGETLTTSGLGSDARERTPSAWYSV